MNAPQTITIALWAAVTTSSWWAFGLGWWKMEDGVPVTIIPAILLSATGIITTAVWIGVNWDRKS